LASRHDSRTILLTGKVASAQSQIDLPEKETPHPFPDTGLSEEIASERY
jgi:hypothetical protein